MRNPNSLRSIFDCLTNASKNYSSSESDAWCATWGSSDSHWCSTDLVAKSIKSLCNALHGLCAWDGTIHGVGGRLGVSGTTGNSLNWLVLLFFISISSPRRRWGDSCSDSTSWGIVLLLLIVLLATIPVICRLVLTIVVSTYLKWWSTAWLMVNLDWGSADLVSEDIESLSYSFHIVTLGHFLNDLVQNKFYY